MENFHLSFFLLIIKTKEDLLDLLGDGNIMVNKVFLYFKTPFSSLQAYKNPQGFVNAF